MSNSQLVIPTSADDLAATSGVFREYAISLGFALCFQDFEGEIANLPGDYAAPRGALLLAHVDGAIAGCCALRPLASRKFHLITTTPWLGRIILKLIFKISN